MSPLEMQPTFSMDFPIPTDAMVAGVRTAIAKLGPDTRAVAAGKCLEIAPPRDETRFWSPHLSVQFSDVQRDSAQNAVAPSADQNPESGHANDVDCQLFGRFSPRPEIWTFCMFLYFAMALVLCCGLLVAYVQWSLGASMTALWSVPISLLVIAGLHTASLIGQGLSRHQMIELRQQLDQILALAVSETPAAERPALSTAEQTPTMRVEITS
ncbi:MAG: hypothetical protein ACF8AM_03775 [Rhodopirellula sp. JB055]|uniref:hypothetical protein n=1 Tax=Rhodopirellula sp. JB055 TaxID=3342846 RepID=UPI003709E07A